MGVFQHYIGSVQAVYRQCTDTIQALSTVPTHFSLFLTPIYGGCQHDETPFALAVFDDFKGNDLLALRHT